MSNYYLQLLLSFLLLMLIPNLAHTRLNFTTINSTLPYGRVYATTAYDDNNNAVYILGNLYYPYFGVNRSILSFNIHLQATTVLPEALNRGHGTSVLCNKGNMYYFGGWKYYPGDSADVTNEILKLNPPQFNETIVVNSLPVPIQKASVVWDGADGIYVLGGHNFRDGNLDSIIKYSLSNNSTKVVGHLPSPRRSTSGVFDFRTKHMYVFGGVSARGAPMNQVVKYDTVSNHIVEFLNITMGQVNVNKKCTSWNGTHAFLLGRSSESQAPMSIINPNTNVLTEIQIDNFPNICYGLGCTFVKELNRIYTFGGVINGVVHSNLIMYMDLGDGNYYLIMNTNTNTTTTIRTANTFTISTTTITESSGPPATTLSMKFGLGAMIVMYYCFELYHDTATFINNKDKYYN